MAKRVLIIEDDLFVRELYGQILQKAGYEVRAAANAFEGMEIVTKDSIDLVLLDIMMPGETGLEFLKKLKSPESAVSEVPVYILSNLGQETVIREAFRLGAQGYLLKARLLPKEIAQEVDAFFSGQRQTVPEISG